MNGFDYKMAGIPIPAFKGIWDRLNYFEQLSMANIGLFDRKTRRISWKIPNIEDFNKYVVRSRTLEEMSPNLIEKNTYNGKLWEWKWEYLGVQLIVQLRSVMKVVSVNHVSFGDNIIHKIPNEVILYVADIRLFYTDDKLNAIHSKGIHTKHDRSGGFHITRTTIDNTSGSRLFHNLSQQMDLIDSSFFLDICACYEDGKYPTYISGDYLTCKKCLKEQAKSNWYY